MSSGSELPLDEAMDAAIEAWLLERQLLLSQFVALPQMSVTSNIIDAIHELCETLVDYTSQGHFRVYEHLLQAIMERDHSRKDQLQNLLIQIHETTDRIVVFDDEYGSVENLTIQDIGHFTGRLSKLGEALTERFNREDQLMALVEGGPQSKIH
ncbi:MAG: sigma D regulator [Gammaproteobacteria bacterium]|nr:sigma D regulator [Gammaproteobacteria bacterium]MCP4881892.1 sigma D regulator [Gammaproteobacteria bacterium]